MKRRDILAGVTFAVLGLTTLGVIAQQAEGKKKKLLFFSPSFGFRHSTVTRPLSGEISHSEKVMKEIGAKAGYDVSLSQDFNDLKSDKDFERFDAIVFYTTQSPPINKDALFKWVRGGGAFIGVHCATDSYYDSPDYNNMIGAQFKTHGPNHVPVTIKVEDKDSPATRHLGDEWKLADEIYQFREETYKKDRLHTLLSIDKDKTDLKTQKMQDGKYYPVSWTNKEGQGRVFYTSLGHREDVWTNPDFQQHLMGGIGWAIAGEQKSTSELK